MIQVGKIVGAHGLKGQVKVEPMTDFFEERFQVGSRLRLKGEWVVVEAYSIHKDRPLLKLSGIKDIDAARALQWEYLEAKPLPEAELEDDEYHTGDLIGLKVVTVKGEELGTVDDVLAYPAQDLLKVGELLIPAVKQFVKSVDLESGAITVELLEGMLEE